MNPPKSIIIHPHAAERLIERGATENEVIETVRDGEPFPAKYDRTGFRRNFPFDDLWKGKHYAIKQVQAIAVYEGDHWIVVTVIVKYF